MAIDELAPNDLSIAENLVVWLRAPDVNFDEATGMWMDSSGKGHNAVPVPDLDQEYLAGKLSMGEPPQIFSQPFATLMFGADDADLMVAAETNGGEGFENITLVAVYKRIMEIGNPSSIRPVGMGAWIAGERSNNFDLGSDPSIRKDNGNIGAGSYDVEHPDDTFLIRIARLDSQNGINEWFNVEGEFEKALTDTGNPYIVGTDNLYLGDLRQTAGGSGTADIDIAEVAVYNTALNEDQIQGISAWLQKNVGSGGGSSRPFQITLLEPSLATNSVSLTWNSRPNRNYTIEASIDLRDWLEVDDGVASEGDETTYTDDAVESGTQVLYYRVKES